MVSAGVAEFGRKAPPCMCGCGLLTTKHRGRVNQFIKGHENIGRSPWNKGRTFSLESRMKMSLARRGKEPANKVPIDIEKLRQLYLDERKNISAVSREMNISKDAIKNRLHSLGWSRSTRESCSTDAFKDVMRSLRIKALISRNVIETPNKLEKLVYGALDKYRVPYEKQAPLFGKFVVDILFPQRHLVLEVFGRYWHTMPVNLKRDYSKKKYLEKCGYSVEELWDNEIRRVGIHPLLERIFKRYNLR